MTSDAELLQNFARERSQAAFVELVRRHLDLVYSAALRQVGGDAHLASDVAQQVFIDLSRKPETLVDHASLVGWLYRSTHYTAANAVRAERRRKKYETEAQAMQTVDHDPDGEADWTKLRPVLDEAMLALDEPDREAVLRRFFSAQSFGEMGAALGLSEDGARRRVERALDKLHGLLARRGITSGAAALGTVLTQHAVNAAPAELHVAINTGAVGIAAPMAAAVGTQLFIMNKVTVGIAAAAVLALLATLVVQGRARLELQEEVEALRAREASAEQAAARAAARAVVVVPPAPPPAPPIVVTDQQRAALDTHYAPLFRRLRLSADKLAQFKDLIVRREQRSREVTTWRRANGVFAAALYWPDQLALRAVVARQEDQELRALLGDKAFDIYLNFERTIKARLVLKSLVDILNQSSDPLRDEQLDQLADWLERGMDYSQLTDNGVQAFVPIPEAVMEQAKNLLTPFQLEKLELVQSGMAAARTIFTMNFAAAEQGQLALVPDSAREFAEFKTQSAATSKP